jgi:hypothetical protein
MFRKKERDCVKKQEPAILFPPPNPCCMTRSRADDVEALFRQSFSCSQAVLAVFEGDFGLDQDTAPKIAQDFGGGITHMDNICGAMQVQLW